jgi:hypothetical protein
MSTYIYFAHSILYDFFSIVTCYAIIHFPYFVLLFWPSHIYDPCNVMLCLCISLILYTLTQLCIFVNMLFIYTMIITQTSYISSSIYLFVYLKNLVIILASLNIYYIWLNVNLDGISSCVELVTGNYFYASFCMLLCNYPSLFVVFEECDSFKYLWMS